MKNPFRIVTGVLLLAAVVLTSSPAGAIDSVEGQIIISCGQWVLKLDDFGKLKIRDYNEYIPENLQQTPEGIQPDFTFLFGPLGFFLDPNEFFMQVNYPDQLGEPLDEALTIRGTYQQKGRKLKFELLEAGVTTLQDVFAELSENKLFGKRALVTDIPYVKIREDTVKFKGRIRDNGDLKAKFKMRMKYDIQYEGGSEFADKVDAPGVFKLRSHSRKCDD